MYAYILAFAVENPTHEPAIQEHKIAIGKFTYQ